MYHEEEIEEDIEEEKEIFTVYYNGDSHEFTVGTPVSDIHAHFDVERGSICWKSNNVIVAAAPTSIIKRKGVYRLMPPYVPSVQAQDSQKEVTSSTSFSLWYLVQLIKPNHLKTLDFSNQIELQKVQSQQLLEPYSGRHMQPSLQPSSIPSELRKRKKHYSTPSSTID